MIMIMIYYCYFSIEIIRILIRNCIAVCYNSINFRFYFIYGNNCQSVSKPVTNKLTDRNGFDKTIHASRKI